MVIVPAAYQLAMFSGEAALKNLQNSRFPNIKTTTLSEFLSRRVKKAA